MSQSFIKLNPKQCAALLHAIVDCDPDLYNQIKSCADEYTSNPEWYELETNIINWIYKNVCSSADGITIEHMEYYRYKASWYDENSDTSESIIVEYVDENHIIRL
jgi:hypothetical protein